MRVISSLLKRVVYPCVAGTGLSRHLIRHGPAVVTYHGLLPRTYTRRDPALDGGLIEATIFRAHLKLLKSRYHLITPAQFLAWHEGQEDLPPRSVLLTCDDGLRNVSTEMLPLLNEAQATCLFFVTGASASDTPSMLWLEELYLMMLDSPTRLDLGALGMNSAKRQPQNKRALWVEAVKHLSRYGAPSRIAMLERIREQLGLPQSWSERYSHDSVSRERFFVLGAEGIRDLVSAGMSIGAHTLSHPMLSQQSLSGATTEITESKANLEAMLGKPIWSFAYPFGSPDSVTQRELDIVKRAGYRCAFMNVGGGFGAKTSPLAFPRMHVTSDMTLPEFEAHLTGLYRLLRERLGRDSTELRADPAQTGRALCAS